MAVTVVHSSIGGAHPQCFYSSQSCPSPCTREEYQRCPINPDVGLKGEGAEMKMSPQVEQAMAHARQVREEMRIMSDPHLREITEAMRAKHRTEGGLVCPSCGDIDHGNRMNKKPWCMKCNLPLMSAEKAAEWVKPQPLKKFPRGFNDPEDVVRWRK